MSGAKHRQKGSRVEREFVALHEAQPLLRNALAASTESGGAY
jgi:hypothetical protein